MKGPIFAVVLFAFSVSAQEDPVAHARSLAIAGQRAEALRVLEARLAERPDDVDARVLYGTVLSWDAQYDRAREELQRVLAAHPDHGDARLALANVERWSRAATRTRRRNEISTGVAYEELAGGDWTELHATLTRGAVVGRIAHAERADLDDQQLEIEVYPFAGRGAYVYLTGAVSTDGTLYPDWRLGGEYFRALGRGFEASAGYRRLAFEEELDLYTASFAKYAGNWLLAGRVYNANEEWSWQALARRYFGDEGNYIGLRAGTARDEIRSGPDVIALDEREIAGEGLWTLRGRWTVAARAGIARRAGDNRARAAVTLGMRY